MQKYVDAIEVLANGNPNFRAIAIALAKIDPLLFIDLHNQTDVANTPQWIRSVVGHLRSDQLVNAIKECRHATGLGLRDAKAVIDHAGHILGLRDAPSITINTPEERINVNAIVNYARFVGLAPQ